MTRDIHTVLVGQPNYKIPGLVEDYAKTKDLVKKHDHIITKWGGGIVAALAIFEILKTIAGK